MIPKFAWMKQSYFRSIQTALADFDAFTPNTTFKTKEFRFFKSGEVI